METKVLIELLRERAADDTVDSAIMKLAANELEILAETVRHNKGTIEEYYHSTTIYEDIKYIFKLMFGKKA